MSSYCSIKSLLHLAIIHSSMVRKNIYNYAYAITFCFFTKSFKVVSSTHLIVTNLPICGLIYIIPFTMPKELITSSLISSHFSNTVLRWRSLNNGVSSLCYISHILLYCIKRPAPCMQYNIVVRCVFLRLCPL